MIQVRNAELADAMKLNMRDADILEASAFSGYPAQHALWLSIKHSDYCYTFYEGEELIAIAGVANGSPWMLASDKVVNYPLDLMRISHNLVGRWKREYGALANYVHAHNAVAIAYIKRLGFTVIEEQVMFNYEPFYLFYMGD